MNNLFLFTGEDQRALQEKLHFWQKEFEKKHSSSNLEVFDEVSQKNLGQIINAIESVPFLADKRMVVVKGFPLSATAKQKIETEALEAVLDDIPESSLVIFVSAKPDKRGRFYKKLAKLAQVETFEVPKGAELARWIQQRLQSSGKSIDQEALGTLVFFCGEHMDRLGGELEKLSLVDSEKLTVADIRRFVSPTPEAKIFQALDLMGKGSRKEVLNAFEKLFEHGGEVMMIFFMLVRQFRLLIQMRSLLDKGQPRPVLQKRLKLAPFQVNMLSKQAQSFHMHQLQQAYQTLADLDFQIKTGRLPMANNNTDLVKLRIDQLLYTLYE